MNRILRFALPVLVALAAPSVTSAQSGADLFQQALRKERVDGDIGSAIELYQRILKEHVADRALSAKVLLQLGRAYEKQGNAEAKAAYQRVVRDYAEQSETAAAARERLAALSPGAAVGGNRETTVRRIWSGTGVDPEGAPTRDGRFLTFIDWQTGDLAVRDLATGENRRLTNKGTWASSPEFALFSVPSPDGKRVAYTWFNIRAESELRVVSMDGGTARVLFSNPEFEYEQPSDWSPDGKYLLAMLSRKDHSTQIAILSTVDGTVHVLKTLDWRGVLKMTFSPDGKYIVYDTPPNDSTQKRDIYVLASDGSSETVLVRHGADDQVMGWSPDGRYVLFASDRTGNVSVWLAPVANGKPAGEPILVRRDAELSMLPMGFTIDGAFIYGADPSRPDLYVATIDPVTSRLTGQPTRLVESFLGRNAGADWSPDGSEVLYVRQQGGLNTSRLLIVRSLATGAEHMVPAKLGYINYVGARWSPDGRLIVVDGRDLKGREGIFTVHPQTGDATMLVEGGNRHFAGWGADGKSIVYRVQDFPNRTWGVVRQDLATGRTTDLFRISLDTMRRKDNRTNLPLAQVSPDGRRVAFMLRTDTTPPSLRMVPVAGGEARELFRSPPGYEIRTLTWSADSRYIFFAQVTGSATGTRDPSKEPVMRIPAAGGAPEETGLAMEGMNSLRTHPDGRRIAFSGGAASGAEVWVIENFLPKAEVSARPRPR